MAPPDGAATAAVKRAPPGFTKAQREAFDRDGFITIKGAIPRADVKRYVDAIDRCAAADPKFNPKEFYSPENIAERDPVFAELIDHPRHIGFAYDLFGELTKLQLSQCMIRPRGGWYNLWHPDGPRAVPYTVFIPPALPAVLKISYWLTDHPRPKMGNLVVMPGSHRQQYFDFYDTDDSVPGEHIVCAEAGDMTVMHCSAWHRVEPNESDVLRKNFFYAYCPSWIGVQDRYTNDPAWLTTLTREQRIIMRSYSYPYSNAKPPKEEFPLFLDRDTGLDRDEGLYHDRVSLDRRKRKLAHEK